MSRKNVPSSSRIHHFTKKYTLYSDKRYGKKEDKVENSLLTLKPNDRTELLAPNRAKKK